MQNERKIIHTILVIKIAFTQKCMNISIKMDENICQHTSWLFRNLHLIGHLYPNLKEMNTILTLHLKKKKPVYLIPERFHMCFRYYRPLLNLPSYQFFPNSSSLSAIYDNFKSNVLKVVKSINRHHFY